MAFLDGAAEAGNNSGVGVDSRPDFLDNECSYGSYIKEKFYEYVSMIEMIYLLSTDASFRDRLITEISNSAASDVARMTMDYSIARANQQNQMFERLLSWFGLGDEEKEAQFDQQAMEHFGKASAHAKEAAEKIERYFRGLWQEIKQRYYECGWFYAVSTTATDAAFFLGELAIGAGVAGVSAKILRGLKFMARRLPDGRIRAQVINETSGASVSKTFNEADLAAKYGKPEENHNGALLDDTNREILDEPAEGMARRQRGKNENEITYDPETGRPISSKGTLREDFGSTRRNDNATAVGKLGESGDQGGHLTAHRFMGDTPEYGIAPQAGNLNMGAWKTMENEWADWIKKGYEVDYHIDVYPPGSVRPDSFDVTYKVLDPNTGKVIYENSPEFKNKSGQKFDRIPYRDME